MISLDPINVPSKKLQDAARLGVPVIEELHMRMFLGDFPNTCLKQRVALDGYGPRQDLINLGYQYVKFCGDESCNNPLHFAHVNSQAGLNKLYTQLLTTRLGYNPAGASMAEISDIRQELEQMSDEELEAIVREKRARRRSPADGGPKPTKKKAKKKDTFGATKKIVKSLTREQKRKLLEELGGQQ